MKRKGEEMKVIPTPTGGGCVPWIVVSDGENQTFYSAADPDEILHRRIETLNSNQVIGQSYGWLILLMYDRVSLWNSDTLETIRLPRLDIAVHCIKCDTAALTLPLDHPDCRVVITGRYRPLIAHCRPIRGRQMINSEWIVQDLSIDVGAYGFVDQVVCSGRLYVMTMESDGTLFEIKALEGDNRRLVASKLVKGGIQRIPNPCRYTCRLVDLEGELLQIRVSFRGSSWYDLQLIRVYKLHRPSMGWVEVQTLQGRSIFLSSEHSFSCPGTTGSGMKLKPNCVYHFRNDCTAFAFDIKKGQSSCSVIPSGRSNASMFGFFLNNYYQQEITTATTATRVLRHCSSVRTELDETLVEKEDKALILELPLDIHRQIANKHLVYVGDYKSYRDTCKRFRLAAPLISPRSSAAPLRSPPYPWFFFSECYMTASFKLHDIRCRNTFLTHLPIYLSDSSVCLCKERWLVMIKCGISDLKFHIYNPVTKTVLRSVPDMATPRKPPFMPPLIFGMSAAPTSPHCSVIIGVFQHSQQRVINIKFLRLHKDTEWRSFRFQVTAGFKLSINCTPAFLDNKFYFLDENMRLGVYSYRGNFDEAHLVHEFNVYAWKLLENNQGLTSYRDFKSNYVVECGGNILAVLTDHLGKSVRVYRFDQDYKGWLEVTDLGSHMLFLSHTCCFSTVAKFAEMGNKIYFPRLSAKGSVVFYSLDTHKYHTFDQEAMDDFRATTKVHFSGWIEPPTEERY
ncbi:F-box/kelch-repeat protein At1g57790 [Linum perenne]